MDIKNSKNVLWYAFGDGAINKLPELIGQRGPGHALFIVDSFFENKDSFKKFFRSQDQVFYIDASDEPTTDGIDALVEKARSFSRELPVALVGIGGGTCMDTAKAISNLLTNGGKAEEYQGWDLVKKPGVYKIAVPTISGTGAEASRTCVMMNYKKNLKLGMNSEFTIYDQIIMDPELSATVPRDQYFYTAMDTYIHCIESLNGHYRHPIGDAFSDQSLTLCRQVFKKGADMMSAENRALVMVASYLGGCAIANSFVGVVHPFSAGLSVVLGTHHCLANCVVMNVMEEFYPKETQEFKTFVSDQKVQLPKGICANLTDEQYERLYLSTVIHEKPLSNALGKDFKNILTREKVKEIFKRM